MYTYRLEENRMLYILAEPCVLDVVLCHPLRLAVCLLLVDSLVLSVVCVCVCARAHTHAWFALCLAVSHFLYVNSLVDFGTCDRAYCKGILQPCIAPSYSSRKLKYCTPLLLWQDSFKFHVKGSIEETTPVRLVVPNLLSLAYPLAAYFHKLYPSY